MLLTQQEAWTGKGSAVEWVDALSQLLTTEYYKKINLYSLETESGRGGAGQLSPYRAC